MSQRICQLVGVMFLTWGVANLVWAVGSSAIGNEVLSARSLGQGAVGIAGENDDPIAVYSNPAALTRLKGTQLTAGFGWENLHGKYSSDALGVSKMRSVDVIVPNFAITQSFLSGKLAAGIAAVSPYGLESHWPGDSPVRYVATNSRIHMVDVTPAVSYRVSSQVSFGAGLDYMNAFDNQLEKNISVSAINSSLPAQIGGGSFIPTADGVSKLSGTGSNFGFHVGMVTRPTERHSLGLAYHSKVKLGINGKVELHNLTGASAVLFGGSDYETSARTDLFIPQNIQFGYAFNLNKRWTFEVDGAWTDWASNRDLNVRYAENNSGRLAVLTNSGAGNPTPLNWSSVFSFASGANYRYSDRLQFRGGAWHIPRSVPESTFSPSLNDLSRYGLTVGAGYLLTRALTIDLAYNAVFFHNRHISNTIQSSSTGISDSGSSLGSITGKYSDFLNILMVNLTYRFL